MTDRARNPPNDLPELCPPPSDMGGISPHAKPSVYRKLCGTSEVKGVKFQLLDQRGIGCQGLEIAHLRAPASFDTAAKTTSQSPRSSAEAN